MNEELISKEQKPRTTMRSNIVSGNINGYKISGIVYNDARMVISIPVKQEVPDNLIQTIEYPKFIKDVRYHNGKVDFLTDIVMFNIQEGESAFETLIEKLIESEIDPDLDYVEERIEVSNNFMEKALLVFAIDVLVGILVSIVVFELQLGQSIGAPNGTFYINYYVSLIFGFAPILTMVLNDRLYTKFKMVNRYNNESALRYEKTAMPSAVIATVISHVFFIVYNGVLLFEMSVIDGLTSVFKLTGYFFTIDVDISSMFIINVGCALFSLGIIIKRSYDTMKRIKLEIEKDKQKEKLENLLGTNTI